MLAENKADSEIVRRVIGSGIGSNSIQCFFKMHRILILFFLAVLPLDIISLGDI